MSTSIFLLIICTAILHASWNFVAKKMSGNLVIIWLGFSIVSSLYLLISWWYLPLGNFSWSEIGLITGAAISLNIYLWALSKAYENGEISFIYPIARGFGVAGTAFLAPFVLGQDFSLHGILGIICICLGILAIGLKSNKSPPQEGAKYALLMGSTTVCNAFLDSIAVRNVHPIFYNAAFTFLAMFFFAPYIFLKYRTQIGTTWKKLKWSGIFIGFTSMTIYMLILFAFRSGSTSYIVALREISIAFGALFGFLLLGEKFTVRKIIGIGIVILGAILIKFA